MTDTTIDLAHLRSWVGKTRTDTDIASSRHARLMAATVGGSASTLADGDAMPVLWHWLYFLEGSPGAELGSDGHPARGGFMPPVPLPNRMWAGGEVLFDAAIPLGSTIQRLSTITAVEHKRGRSGDLVFVTVEHLIEAQGTRCIQERQDIVFKTPAPAGNAAAPADGGPAPGQHQRQFEPDSTLLFRYSALTFNGHRIHYDLDYCRREEGYENLVIHGPLVATELARLADDVGPGRLRRFSYRGMRPALLGATLQFNADVDGQQARLWSQLPDGGVSMQAEAQYD